MSKQLAISAAFSTFAMAAFVLLATPDAGLTGLDSNTGANSFAPAVAQLPEAPALLSLAD